LELLAASLQLLSYRADAGLRWSCWLRRCTALLWCVAGRRVGASRTGPMLACSFVLSCSGVRELELLAAPLQLLASPRQLEVQLELRLLVAPLQLELAALLHPAGEGSRSSPPGQLC
jgi:hypothetical protein